VIEEDQSIKVRQNRCMQRRVEEDGWGREMTMMCNDVCRRESPLEHCHHIGTQFANKRKQKMTMTSANHQPDYALLKPSRIVRLL
jgi:hypothetical protein